jgi:hypothetical protein
MDSLRGSSFSLRTPSTSASKLQAQIDTKGKKPEEMQGALDTGTGSSSDDHHWMSPSTCLLLFLKDESVPEDCSSQTHAHFCQVQDILTKSIPWPVEGKAKLG